MLLKLRYELDSNPTLSASSFYTGFGLKPKTSRFSDSQREVLLHLSREKNLDSEKNLRKKRDDGPPLSLVAGSKRKVGHPLTNHYWLARRNFNFQLHSR